MQNSVRVAIANAIVQFTRPSALDAQILMKSFEYLSNDPKYVAHEQRIDITNISMLLLLQHSLTSIKIDQDYVPLVFDSPEMVSLDTIKSIFSKLDQSVTHSMCLSAIYFLFQKPIEQVGAVKVLGPRLLLN